MKSRWVFFVCYQSLFLAWCFHIHSYCFEFTLADQIGLVIVGFIPVLIFYWLKKRIPIYLGVAILLGIPVLIFPLVDLLREFYASSWVVLYLALLVTGVAGWVATPLKWTTILLPLLVWYLPYPMLKNQHRYYDKLTHTIETRKGEVDVVKWKSDRWIYYNELLLISTIDGHMHTETLIHTVLPHFDQPNVLLIGGDHGYTAKELNKYLDAYDHLPYDFEFARLQHEYDLIDQSISSFLSENQKMYDVIVVDLPDPDRLPYRMYYQTAFYQLLFHSLSPEGAIITNGASSLSSTSVSDSIRSNLKKAASYLTELQAHVPTMGERTWFIASQTALDLQDSEPSAPTRWINREAISMMLATRKKLRPSTAFQ
ncbi:MAG: hypothetical protein AAGA66_13840 [Bacteroidota bacterium]